MKKAVVLLSGGLDSAVTAYIARKDVGVRGGLYAMTFDYGQVHVKEVQCAEEIGKLLKVESHHVIKAPLGNFVRSALTGHGEIPIEGSLSDRTQGVQKTAKSSIPSTWVPQRNSIFLALAFGLAETVGADLVYTGFNVRDYSGYPDCRPEFVEQMQKALNLASKRFVETGNGIGITCPIIHKTKAEVIVIGLTLSVPFEKTWSCYQGREKACGVCASCRIRLAAFAKVARDDPIEYEKVG